LRAGVDPCSDRSRLAAWKLGVRTPRVGCSGPARCSPSERIMSGPALEIRGASSRRFPKTPLAFRLAFALLGLIAFGISAAPASAQIPKGFKYYEDSSDLGFKIKVPAEWNFIPGTPADPNLIGKYDVKSDQGIQITGFAPWPYSVWLVKFDRRKSPSDAEPKKEDHQIQFRGAKNAEEYLGEIGMPGSWKKVDKEGGPLGIQGVEASSSVYALMAEKTPLRLYVATYKLSDDVDVAFIANCSGDEKKWSKFLGAFNTMGRSFKRVDIVKIDATTVKAGESALRTQTRARLEAKIKVQPGWKLYETPNYFIVSNNSDKEFIDELMMRLEKIRKVYEETYPVEKALELRKRRDEAMAKKKADDAASGKGEPGAEGGQEPGDDPEDHTESQPATPLEQSRCSVVRVAANEDQYHSYGGPESTAGYWNWVEKELVIFDDKARGGRNGTWSTLNHEAFHQYIYYLLGNLSPHSWFNEGTGDFYSGYQLKNNVFELKPFDWRVQTIKDALRQRDSGKETFVPLKKLVRFTQRDYYEPKTVGRNYAQGWSFVWFLRTGPKNYRGWNKAWSSILEVYLETLAVTNDLDQAVDKAFAGVDFDELEKAWIDYTLAI
jgi:hypothetical protein